MAREEDTGKSEAELRERIWELAEDIAICVLVTWDGKQQQARPMSARLDGNRGVIFFLTAKTPGKTAEISEYPAVTASFANSSKMKFVTFSGRAAVSNDRAKIRELWHSADKAWWESPDDPDIRLITFRPDRAEIWDSPGMLVSGALMLAAAVGAAKPKIGDHAKVAMGAGKSAAPAGRKTAATKSVARKPAAAKPRRS
jgi:general stress protein 26